eukprot:TRINITY_DN63970_c0_g1_i1.p1 TRINITY_DN63970_c0_g1~~TRINITY_DN63970_c0_g1_i1.p1  ORF type:complete len:299 (-),score=32.83 TRINITY_DN63970_c0_g1_i1:197-1093(-)
MSLDGQVAVITGGTGGIGWSSAQEWMARGGKVVLADIQEKKGKELAATHPGKVVFVKCDTRKREDLERAAAAASELGELTCWFNNAGFGRPDDIPLLKEHGFSEDLRNMLDVNLNAYIEGIGVALRSFNKDKGGVIVSTASMAGILPLGAPPVYSASKAAVVHLTRAIGLTLGDKSNIRVYCLCPSYTATSQGPPTDVIKGSLGGVLRAEHMGDGFIMLATQKPANGSIMRVTARSGGKRVVHDILVYGRELGGSAPTRDGVVMKDAPLEALSKEDMAKLDGASLPGREHDGMRTSKL